MAKKKEATETTVAEAKPTFTKREFVKSNRFAKHRDIINVLLEDDKKYTIEEVETTISDFFSPKKTK